MSFLRKPQILIITFVLFIFAFINIIGCEKNDIPNISEEAIQAAAIVPVDENETDPTTEIISGTMIYFKDTEVTETTEITEIITEIFEIIETIEITETSETTTEIQDLYVITPSGKKYHYPTCRTVKSIKQYLTKEEAEASGYEPCKICNPE